MTNKPNRRTIRLQGYDYSPQGLYYITICTQDKARLFGEVMNGEVVLNGVGRIVEIELKKTEQIRDNMRLDEFIIMPNHIHFIVGLNVGVYCIHPHQQRIQQRAYSIRPYAI